MPYTLITGASSGIGWELAHVFAEKKHNLILVARSERKLQELKADLEQKHGIQAVVVTCDLAQVDGPRRLFERTRDLEVEVLVNNAGFGDLGLFTDSNWDRQRDMIQVNITSLTELTHLFLPSMTRRKRGWILNVASTAAFQAGPLMAVYYATKAYVLSFSEALYEELKPQNISVTALCPGPTASGFQSAAHMDQVPLFEKMPLPSSRDVAEYGYDALMKGKPIAIHGTVNRLMATSVKFLPRSLPRQMVKKLQEKR